MYRMPPGFGPQSMGPISQFGQMMPFRGGFPAARSAGFLSRFLSPNPGAGGGLNLIGMVENVQKVMKMADTVRPMIQQYGPMIKNFPSMLQLLKEYQNYSSDSSSDEESETETQPEQKKSSTTSGKKSSSSGTTTSGKKTSTSGKKKSTAGKKTSKASSGSQKSSTSGKTMIKKTTMKKNVPKVKQISSGPSDQRNSVPKLYI
ncbi:YqfQ family protein [Pseudalkalibacillus berkeleyi]|uniref:YqfQ family protein n=1 Tax=Pseudalkalibacillus berkeleyi TaxID=1069813 RepID=A0ABS9H287_9BACL|nr:YqfQ family protein [Pseudalkalibacillus berkeleyi]MCF6137945.1 YqfQ family protein [Pseudalkalibacillus berkeleyi]